MVLGLTLDLSEGGLRMRYDTAMEKEQSLLLRLAIPGGEPIQALGRRTDSLSIHGGDARAP